VSSELKPPVTPGVRTTEFWLALVTMVLSLLTAAGVVGSEQAGELARPVASVIAGAIVIAYTVARTKAKIS